ncbi:hypothetical protein Pint_31691 [Pistacia integerrima]|uniref:Uncharacterized protein n=1 Tax=Pistacia integerrima TaxID=434235 RepID=A0ACC0XQI5_9ROSI|nr:hypothetical protein Pint_31691 [Pistacia integerrima]
MFDAMALGPGIAPASAPGPGGPHHHFDRETKLSEAGVPEQVMYYHMVPEYQTEESMCNRVRRFGKVKYDTLRVPHKVKAQEADGSVKFGAAYLFDPNIYTDGMISVKGIDGVLFPVEEETEVATKVMAKPSLVAREVRSIRILF